jgi:hypothetical protein
VRAPTVEAVLLNTAPTGRTVRLRLNEAQKRALADPDGKLLCRVLRAFLRARHAGDESDHPSVQFSAH